MSRSGVLGTAASIASVLILGGTLSQTVLFNLSPIKIGYVRRELGGCVAFVPRGTRAPDLRGLPEALARIERSHGWTFASRVQIVLCGKQSDMDRFMPYIDAADRKKALAFAAWPDTVYLTPRAVPLIGTERCPIEHELSHVLLFQRFGLPRTAMLWRLHQWIPEGFATYLTGFPNYFPPERLKKEAAAAGIDGTGTGCFRGKTASKSPLPIRFMVYRGFIERLDRAKGRAAALRFLVTACERPLEVDSGFIEVFGRPFEREVADFWEGL